MLDYNNLHPYQLRVVKALRNKNAAALFMRMGLGKTAVILTAAVESDAKKILVIAPLYVAESVWRQEAAKWKQLQHLKFSLCTGSLAKRRKALQSEADIYLINPENIKWLVEQYPGRKWPFDTVIVDESQRFKNPSTQRFIALKKIIPYTKRRYILSGTVNSKEGLGIWSQIYILDEGVRLGNTFGSYRDRYFNKIQRPAFTLYHYKKGASTTIMRKIKDIAFTMHTEDYLKLPPITITHLELPWPTKARKVYDKLKESGVLDVGGYKRGYPNEGVGVQALLQVCSGAIFKASDDLRPTEWVHVHNAKLDALDQLLEDTDENVVVAYHFRHDLERLQARFPEAKTVSPANVAAWNRGEIRLLLAQPISANTGLNLQQGGRTIVWFTPTWDLDQYVQMNARLHRQGQELPVNVYHLSMEGSVELVVSKTLGRKEKVEENLFDYLKRTSCFFQTPRLL